MHVFINIGDDGRQGTAHCEVMTPTRRRLAIAVMPRLLGDLLSRALAREDRDIVVMDTPSAGCRTDDGAPRCPFDIALVSDRMQEVAAAVVICLVETPVPGVAHVGAESVPISDLQALIALVDRCAAALEEPSGAVPDG